MLLAVLSSPSQVDDPLSGLAGLSAPDGLAGLSAPGGPVQSHDPLAGLIEASASLRRSASEFEQQPAPAPRTPQNLRVDPAAAFDPAAVFAGMGIEAPSRGGASDDAAPRRKRPPKSPLERHLPLTPASVNEVTKLINEASAEAEHDLGDNESPAQASVQRQLDALLGMMPKGAAPRTATEDAAI